MYYYRIYDDKEQLNHLKSALEEQKIRELLKEFERDHQQYYNTEFIDFLKRVDPKAEMIEVVNITY